MRGIGELQVNVLWENVVLPVRGSVGVARYDLCVAGSCVIPSWGNVMIRAYAALTPM